MYSIILYYLCTVTGCCRRCPMSTGLPRGETPRSPATTSRITSTAKPPCDDLYVYVTRVALDTHKMVVPFRPVLTRFYMVLYRIFRFIYYTYKLLAYC